MRIETIGNATLYLGDCLEILPTLPKVDAVITDPPYGIGAAWGTGKSWQTNCGKSRMWEPQSWDVKPPAQLLANLTNKPCIIWGANYMDGLPLSKGWLVWDKCADMTQAQAELAWTNVAPNARVFRKSPLAVWGNAGANDETKEHPTQKPLCVIEWCFGFVPKAELILDPFMGSGTTGVACMNLGRKFIGIEIEPKYYDIACRRIEDAQRQKRLFA